jgi:hypothetical protein
MGRLVIRNAIGGERSQFSSRHALTDFPLTWTTGALSADSPGSMYLQQVPPVVQVSGPPDGGRVSGRVGLSATVDDDVPMRSVQFLVDDVPAGPPLTAPPYTQTWDSSTATTHEFHTLSARAVDALGRSNNGTTLWVSVDNGARISEVTASAVTSTSAWISWSTDSASDGQVEFGQTTTYSRAIPVDYSYGYLHRQQATGLTPNTTYHYRVKSRDLRGVQAASIDYTFSTPP